MALDIIFVTQKVPLQMSEALLCDTCDCAAVLLMWCCGIPASLCAAVQDFLT